MGDIECSEPAERCCASNDCRERVNHIRCRPRRNRGNQYYLDRGPSGAENTLCGAKPTCRDAGWGDTRWESRLNAVECDDCREIRART